VSYFLIYFFWENLFGQGYIIEVEKLKLIMLVAFLICHCLFLNNVLQCYGLTNLSTPIITIVLPILNILQFLIFDRLYYENVLVFIFFSYLICWLSMIMIIYIFVLNRKLESIVLSTYLIKLYLIELFSSVKERINFWLVSMLAICFSHLPIIIISKQLEANEIAYLVYSIRISSLVSFPLAAINANIAHKISVSYKENNIDKIKELYFNGIKTMLLISTIPIVIIMLFSEDIMQIFGEGFSKNAVLLKILIIGELVNIACGSTGVTLSMTNKEKYNLISSLFVGIIFVASLSFISSAYGIYGVTVLYSIRLALWNLMGLFFVYRHVFN
jgi:O-antigen/teichoic acid export membrane protein